MVMDMKDKKVGSVIKTETKIIAIVVICLVITVIGISYALFLEVKGNEKNQIVKAGTLEFTYANGSQITNASNSDCFIPMNNEEALRHSECEYKISITNTGTLPGNYNINLNSESVENPLALNKLKVILKKEGQVVEGYPKEGTTTALIANEKIEAGRVINYTVQVYVDADNELLNADDDEKNISIKINGDAIVNSEQINPDNSILAANYITILSKKDSTNLMADDTNDANIRYVGSSPNNYIDIGDKDSEGNPILWRIIGVMNNITTLDNDEKQESLVKIIRAESIGGYSWDTSAEGINSGYGVNEWSEADVMKLLNPNTVYSETPAIGGSLYWDKKAGKCYIEKNENNEACDFTSSGITDEAKEKIAKVRWNTGTLKEAYNNSEIPPKYMYEGERSSHNGKKQCESTGGDFCNDGVKRTTTWEGYIGLIYPSDFGYAVGGDAREECITKSLYVYYKWNCNANNWLFNGKATWTITPVPHSKDADFVFGIPSTGYVDDDSVRFPYEIIPVAYLKSSVKIIENPQPDKVYGSLENPFILE